MRARTAWTAVLLMLVAVAAGVLGSRDAEAAKVANPGTFTATVTDGFLRIKQNTFAFDPNDPIKLTGTIASNGDVNIPESGQHYPSFELDGGYTVYIRSAAPITGFINPLTGVASLRLKVWIKIDGVPFGGGCRIASRTSPIDVNTLITGTTSPPGPNSPISGTPYNSSNGTMKIVNNNFSVPTSSDCGPGAGTVNDTLGLPSSSGNNEAQFEIQTSPVLRKGITADLDVSGTQGIKPYTVNFDASDSTHAAAVRNYQWDFDGNGTFDRTTADPTTSFTYTTAGTYVAKMRITDVDSDTAEATRTITVVEPPDLKVESSHTDPFRVGTQGRYDIDVTNLSPGPTNGTTTVTDTLPAGLTYAGFSGAGWSCGALSQVVTCTRSGQIAGNAAAPRLAIDVNVTAAAIPGGDNNVSVQTTGDSNSANDTDSDPTTVTVIDLAIDKSHEESFRLGSDPANLYTLSVTNPGSAATVGSTTVSDTLPEGLTFVSATGAGWSCSAAGQQVTCVNAASIAGGASAAPIELRTAATLPAGETSASVTNTASVSTTGDAFDANDADSDPTLIIDAPDLEVRKSHNGTFTAGREAVFIIDVANVGPLPTTDPSTVTDTLPAGLGFVSATGAGWDCSEAGGEVTCVRNDSIDVDTAAPAIELRVSVGRGAIPSVDNTATVATEGDGNPANDSSTDTANVRAIDLVIEKSHDEPFRLDRQGIYRLDVENIGDSETVSTVTVEDTLPDGLDFVSATGTDWSCSAAGQDVTCTSSEVLSGGEAAPRITLRVDVGEDALPAVSNTATVATTDDFNLANNSSTDDTAITEADAAVAITRTGGFIGAENGTYLISVDNEGTRATTGTTEVSVPLPAGLAFVSAEGDGWTCLEDAGVVTCERTDSIPAESAVPDIALRVAIDRDAPASVTTTATVTAADDRNSENDSASDTVLVTGPDLTVASAHAGSFRVGGKGVYELTVENEGTRATRSAITVTDTLPAGLDFVSAEGPGWACDASGQDVSCIRTAELEVDQVAPKITLTVVARAAAVPSVVNEVTVSTTGDRDPADDSDSDQTAVEMIDLRMQLNREGPVVVGEETVYQVVVTNDGDAPTHGPTRVGDALPTGLTPSSASGPGWTCSVQGGEVKCDHDAVLGAGEQSDLLTIRADVGSDAGTTVTNTATVAAADDANPANDSDSDTAEVIRAPDMKASIDDELPMGGSFRIGGEGSYLVSVRNRGGAPTSAPTEVSLELGLGMEARSATGDGWECSTEGRLVDCVYDDPFAPGDRSDLHIDLSMGRTAHDTATTAARVSVADDADGDNDFVSATSPITRIDLRADKSHDRDFQAGERGTYELGTKNLGSAATVGPTAIVDTLPSGITFVSASGTGWSCRGSADSVICIRRALIAPSATAPPVTVTVDVADEAVPSVTSSARVETRDDVNTFNDRVTDSVSVSPRDQVSMPAELAMERTRPTESGIVYLRLSCPDESEAGCDGTVSLESANRLRTRPGDRRRTLSFGEAEFEIKRGHTFPVALQLSDRQMRTLSRRGKLTAAAEIRTDGFDPDVEKFVLRGR